MTMAKPVTGFLSRPRGFGFVFAAFIFFVVGLIYGLGQLYIMFAAIVLLPAASYVVGWSALRRLKVQRRLPRQAAEGDTVRVELQVANQGRYGKPLFRIDDQLPEWLDSEDPGGNVTGLAAGETQRLHYRARASKRGVFPVGPAMLSASDPVALFEFRAQAAPASELVVHPRPAALTDLPLGGDPLFEGRRPSRQRAEDGIDFHSTREYQPGDDLRRIHWKSSARRDTFTVLEFERSYSGGVTVVLDLRPEVEVGVGRHTALEYAVKAAAGIAQQVLSRAGPFRLIARGAADHSLAVGGKAAQLGRVLDALARVKADGTEGVGEALRGLPGRVRAGRSVVVISPSVEQETLTALGALARRGVAAMAVLLRGDTFALAAAGADDMRETRAPSAPAPDTYHAYVQALRRAGVVVRQVRCFDPEFRWPTAGEVTADEKASAA